MSPLRKFQTCLVSVTFALTTCATAAIARVQNSYMDCDAAASQAADQTGVPFELLMAITRVETGRGGTGRLTPWPWAVNKGGESHWFDTEAEALQFVEQALVVGSTNIDVGCFQLNHRWHGAAFPSLQAMFDPKTNALHAARFLADLQAKSGDWRAAVAAYHSRTPEYAERYLSRYDSVIAAMALQAGRPAVTAAAVRNTEGENSYPLLRAGLRGSAGSLVPKVEAGKQLFGTGD